MAIVAKGIEGRGTSIYRIDPKQIVVVGGWNPRTDFSGEEELMESIVSNGVLESNPLAVRKIDDRVVLVNGERRLRATLRAIKEGHDIATVPAIFLDKNISDVEAMFVTLISNDGKRLNPVEEAEAFRRLKGWGLSAQEIATRIGRSEAYVTRTLSLTNASPELKKELKEKKIGVGEARKIVKKSSGSVDKQKEELAKAKKEKEEKPEGRGRLPLPIEQGKKIVERLVAEKKAVLATFDATIIMDGKVLFMAYNEKRHEKAIKNLESNKHTNIIEAVMPMSNESFEKNVVANADRGAVNLVVFTVAEGEK